MFNESARTVPRSVGVSHSFGTTSRKLLRMCRKGYVSLHIETIFYSGRTRQAKKTTDSIRLERAGVRCKQLQVLRYNKL